MKAQIDVFEKLKEFDKLLKRLVRDARAASLPSFLRRK